MQRDHGWIHTLLEEAENERMHLLTFMELRQTGRVTRALILTIQGIFFNWFFLCYLVSPRFCHRFVGYLEEEAVKTYTHVLAEIDNGSLAKFAAAKASPLAVSYWKLSPDAPFRDLINAIRADEAGHRLVNHTFADMHEQKLQDRTNPFVQFSTYGETG
jgi:threonyl-tRNA synthetase